MNMAETIHHSPLPGIEQSSSNDCMDSHHVEQSMGVEQSMVQIIKKKRNGQQLTESDIQYFVSGAIKGDVTEAQIGMTFP